MGKFNLKTIYADNLRNKSSSSKYRVTSYDIANNVVVITEKDSTTQQTITFEKLLNNIAVGQIYVVNLGNLSKDMSLILNKYDKG